MLSAAACERTPAQPDGAATPEGSAAGAPQRIVSTMPSTTEMLWRFGVWERVVARSMFDLVPAEAASLPSVGSGMDPDVERVLSLRPDLVVGSVVQRDYAFVRTLRDAGVSVHLVADQGLDEVLDAMPALGDAVGAGDAARALCASLRVELDALRARWAGAERPRVLMVYGMDPIYAAGPDAYVSALLDIAGGANVLSAGDWVQLDDEAVIHLAPDVILAPLEGDATEEALRATWARLHTVPAVRDGRVFGLRAHGVSMPGPDVANAAREIGERLHGP